MKISTAFSGIGAPEMGLQLLGVGHEVLWACEIDKHARQSYKAIYEGVTVYEDFKKLDYSQLARPDVAVFGFPCQAFSIAGNRNGFEDVRGTLIFDVATYVKEAQPEVVVLENVKGLINHEKGKTLATILSLFCDTVNLQPMMFKYPDNLGYHCHWKVLNSRDFGVPQNRERIFLVLFKDPNKARQFQWPKGWQLDKTIADVVETDLDVAISTFDRKTKERVVSNSNISPTLTIPKQGWYDPQLLVKQPTYAAIRQRHDYEDGNRLIEQRVGDIAPTVLATNGSTKPLLAVAQFKRIQQEDYWKATPKIKKDFVAGTVCAKPDGKSGDLLITPTGHKKLTINGVDYMARPFTPLECWRLQGFPDWAFQKAKEAGVSNTQLLKQAGNSMTTTVIGNILKAISLSFPAMP